MRYNLIFILIVLAAPVLKGQGDYERELSKNRALLKELQSDINRLKSQLDRAKNEESTVVEQLDLIDKEVALIARSRGLLERQSRILAGKIDQTNQQLEESRQRLSSLRRLYAQRAVYTYKYGRIRNLQLLLTSQSFNQALIRYRYLKMIAEHDERTMQSIREKQAQIEDMRRELSKDLALKRSNLAARKQEEQTYLSRKDQKTALLKKLRWNQTTYRKQLARKQEEKERLNNIIVTLERQRLSNQNQERRLVPPDFKFDDFARAKGKLQWPVKGRVSSRYGKQYDKRSKTYIKNTDIEIQSTLGTPVSCVFKGIVRMITYLPGYGNTIIIDHGKGYYTVYSHLDQIYVHKDDLVKTSQMIATVGDSGSLDGAKLQFGIYGGQKTYNPEKWLD